ncbi:hypothetical protein [Psychrobacter sp. AOP31-A1-22]|uniref:hypothetical protein n=1 Tax=Psychrobacter sp. AOP31-A1-22 TaxID=3457696 RepID=UPI0040366A7D
MKELNKFKSFIKDLQSQGMTAAQIKTKGGEYIQSLDHVKQAQLSAAWSTQKAK